MILSTAEETLAPTGPQRAEQDCSATGAVRPAHAPSRRAAPKRGKAARKLPLPVMLFLLSLCLPPETYFSVFDLTLSPQRILLLCGVLPWMVAVLLAGRRVVLPDFLLLFHVLWVIITFCVHHGPQQGAQSGGIYFVEVLGPYFLARRYLSDVASFRQFVKLLAWVVIAMAVFTVPEALTGRNYLREGFAQVFGAVSSEMPSDQRLGLTRSAGPFPHPILYGVFCSGALALSWYVLSEGRRITAGRAARALGITLSTAMSVSTGALLSLMLQIGLITWDHLANVIKHRWLILAVLFVCAYAFVDFASNRDPVSVFISYATLNPQTGYDRKLTWDFGSAEVWRNPLWGIGFNDWTRPDWMHNNSVDNFWLLLAMRHGLPAALAMLAAVGYTVWRAGKLKQVSPKVTAARRGWVMTLLSLSVAGVTVHFWGSSLTFFCLLLGSGVWMMRTPQRPSGVTGRL